MKVGEAVQDEKGAGGEGEVGPWDLGGIEGAGWKGERMGNLGLCFLSAITPAPQHSRYTHSQEGKRTLEKSQVCMSSEVAQPLTLDI